MTVQIKEIKVFTEEGKDVFVALYIKGEKVSCFKDYSEAYYELASAEKERCRNVPIEGDEEISLYKEISGTKEEIIEKIKAIGYDNSRIESDFCLCVEEAEEEVKSKEIKMEKNYYLWNGEKVVLMMIDRRFDGKEYVVEYNNKKFNNIPFIEENGTFAVVRLADIEASGIEILPKDACLSYDDFYAGDWCGADEIQERKVPNFEDPQRFVYEYVTDSWHQDYLEEEEKKEADRDEEEPYRPSKYTIAEIQEKSGESVEEALREFMDSCFRNGCYDAEDNISYFMRENNICCSEKDELLDMYMTIEKEFEE